MFARSSRREAEPAFRAGTVPGRRSEQRIGEMQ